MKAVGAQRTGSVFCPRRQRKHKAKVCLWPTKAVEAQGKGSVFSPQRQWKHTARACLYHKDSGSIRQKAVSYGFFFSRICRVLARILMPASTPSATSPSTKPVCCSLGVALPAGLLRHAAPFQALTGSGKRNERQWKTQGEAVEDTRRGS